MIIFAPDYGMKKDASHLISIESYKMRCSLKKTAVVTLLSIFGKTGVW